MRYLRTLLFAGLSLCCLTTWGQPVSTQLRPGKVPEGTVYYLPKTVIHFHLLIERKVYTPGAFCNYAERYLRLQPVGKEKKTDHRLLNLQMSQTGVRDTSKCFVANLKGKSATAEIHLSDDAVLLAVNDSPILSQQPRPFVAAPKKTPSNPLLLLNGEARKAGSTARMAELTALQIAELQEHRQQLITGEAEEMPEDKAQLQLMLDEIDRQSEGLMSLFTGTTLCDTTEQVISLCPDKEMKREVIFRISKQLGLVDKDDLSGIPFYVTLEDLHQQRQQDYEYPENKKDGGFYTNVPGFVRLTLYREEQQLASYTYPLAQFGFTELRSGSLFKKYPATQLVLNPITGAVERLHADIPEKEE
ncbi:MAG: DUF4831 family protein [Prevotella sp.]|nr:DUF4831 family protein [Prevotella sp.]